MSVSSKAIPFIAAVISLNFGCASSDKGTPQYLADGATATADTAIKTLLHPAQKPRLPCYEPGRKHRSTGQSETYVMHRGRLIRVYECM
jgi:hypothetical protein